MGSKRLPGKVMKALGNKSLLGWVIDRVRLSKLVDEIWLATSTDVANDAIAAEGKNKNIYVFRGSEEDVLDRFQQINLKTQPNAIVRITADNPFICPVFMDKAIDELKSQNIDYVTIQNIPLGSSVEVFSRQALEMSAQNVTRKEEKEHVIIYIKII